MASCSRLHGVRQRVEPVLNLAGLLADRIQRTGVVCVPIAPPSVAEGALVAQVVACRAADLRHGRVRRRRIEREESEGVGGRSGVLVGLQELSTGLETVSSAYVRLPD